MKKILNISLLLICCSCSKMLIEPDKTNSDPERNFEIFWNDINNTYPFFDFDEVDWKEMYDKNRGKINSATTSSELFTVMAEMMEPLMDGHAYLSDGQGNVWVNQRHFQYEDYYNYQVVNHDYLNDNVHYIVAGTDTLGKCGIMDTDVLYFKLNTFSTEVNISDTIAEFMMNNSSARGFILDLRGNGGGYLYQMNLVAGLFTNQPLLYGYYREKIGPLKDNFTPFSVMGVNPSLTYYYGNKPVVVLTNRQTVSAAEHCTLALRELPNVSTVGDTTYGANSAVIVRSLPNKFSYLITSGVVYDLDFNVYERKGIPPQYPMITSDTDFTNGIDRMLDKAFTLIP